MLAFGLVCKGLPADYAFLLVFYQLQPLLVHGLLELRQVNIWGLPSVTSV